MHPRTTETWLEGRRLDSGAEGLWRVHDKLYDLTDFISKHPGGKEWIELTQVEVIKLKQEIYFLRIIIY